MLLRSRGSGRLPGLREFSRAAAAETNSADAAARIVESHLGRKGRRALLSSVKTAVTDRSDAAAPWQPSGDPAWRSRRAAPTPRA
ncbi:hypothetical protein [Streptomyces sp. NPDC005141]